MQNSKMTNLIPLKLSHFSVIGLLFVLNMPSAIPADAPGVLAQEPLQTSATAKPNIMFHVDNSGSMYNIVVENTSTFTCDDTDAIIPDGETVELVISGTGASSEPKIKYDGNEYELGNEDDKYCFLPNGTYYTALTTNTENTITLWFGDYDYTYLNPIPYKGNQLNWYFDKSTDSGADNWETLTYKPGTSNRHTIARDSLKDLLDSLNNVRVGLSSFDRGGAEYGGDGASIDVNVADITSSHTTDMKTAIDGIDKVKGTATPLGESLRDLGRYFSNNAAGNCGGGATNLTIHPDNLTTDTPAKENVACTTLLDTRITNTDNPISAWCQKNFVVMLTDGQPSYDRSIAAKIKDYDQDCTADGITAGTHTSCDSYDRKNNVTYPLDANNLESSDHWDDVAQALHEIDLRPDLDDTNDNEYVNNITTYTIGFADEQVKNHPLISQTATQGGGSFIFAEDSANLASAFKTALSAIIAQTSTSSAVTFNSSTLSSQSAVYQALFNTSSWSGELNSFPINGITGAIETNCTQGTNNCWKAADQLDAQDPSDRFIITYSDASNGVEFKYVDGTDDYTNLSSSSDIPQALVDDLCSTAVGTVSGTSFPCLASDTGSTKTANSVYIEDLVNYLRGDNSEEGASSTREFRTRLHDLADIVNSSPVFVGKPQQNWPTGGKFPDVDGSSVDISYRTWKYSSVKDRPEVVYVASNDGMLHGFRADASTDTDEDVNTSAGEEVFAYIPTGAFSTSNSSGLHFLANKNYSHRFYNDLSPAIADVYMEYKGSGGTPTGTFNLATEAQVSTTADWRTVLLGSQGGGGKSLYLLDVTDPVEYTDDEKQDPAKLVLWEFTHADLGYTYSKPTIAMMNNGRFAAIFGSGYSEAESSSCEAKLFVVFLEGGLDGTWTEDTDYFIYDTGVGGTSATSDECNGMSTPAVVDLNGDGTADRVYAGDLEGNLWAFDLCNLSGSTCSATASEWGIADTNPLMYAEDNSNNRIPITTKPLVSRDPASSGSDDLIVVFGTGQYLTDLDKATTGLQRMYGVQDYAALSNTKGNWNRDGGNTKWAVTVFDTDATTGARIFESTETIGMADYGWRIDLIDATDPVAGERLVVNPKIRNNILFFNTLIPDDTTCSFGGSGWIMSVNLTNGGIPPHTIFDLNDDGIIDDTDVTDDDEIPAGESLNEIPGEGTFLGDNQYTPGSDGTINVRKVDVGTSRREGRMSWKEVYEAQ